MQSQCKFADSKILGETVHSVVGNIMVVHKPIEALSAGCDIIGHDFPEPLIVGDDKEVDHDDVAEFELVDDVGHAHLAEGVEDDDGGLGVGGHVVLDLAQEDARVLELCHWEEDELDGVVAVVLLQPLSQVVD